ncbi:hypothetical protein SAMN05444002_0317 [Vannielia litorea]|uniref:Uncharacterized protein n=2 Tax=Vannielia litorea TaxID=1217970 RepID=A0A1N6E4C4_9RHOB|nr:hypothetical protein SAMN05444002_0317 [Vannielia litorea]
MEESMGNPKHYGIELPVRCLELIEKLWPAACEVHGGERPDLGPLTSTFLLSMSIPVINIPLERIERHINKPEGATYADDRHLNAEAEKAFDDVIRKGRLSDAPFYQTGVWHFVQVEPKTLPNIAKGLSTELANELRGADAEKRAHEMNASQWVSVLRNAMAHGGIAYLDENGHSTDGAAVRMYAFVSGKYGKPQCQHAEGDCRFGMGELERINILRISEDNYKEFLRRWVAWLVDTTLVNKTAA